MVYYNEYDKSAAAWLRELIKEGLISNGEVDERSIVEVEASDIAGFRQHHFFAGIGGWSYALRIAGWPDDIPVWTASLPCQPFSVAGKQLGKSDERHLLPHFIELVRKCNPATLFGGQVPGAIRHGWLDDLYAEMEDCGYSCGSIIAGAHSVGAAHIRQRLYWVADSNEQRLQRRARTASSDQWAIGANSMVDRLYCRDGKYRPIESGIKPLVDGVSRGMVHSGNQSAPINANATQEARAMRLRGYGNAIVPKLAAQFIESFMEIITD